MIYSCVWEAGDIWANRGFGRQAISGLIVGVVGRRYMIYSGVYELVDIWSNCGCGKHAVYDIFGCLGGRRQMG